MGRRCANCSARVGEQGRLSELMQQRKGEDIPSREKAQAKAGRGGYAVNGMRSMAETQRWKRQAPRCRALPAHALNPGVTGPGRPGGQADSVEEAISPADMESYADPEDEAAQGSVCGCIMGQTKGGGGKEGPRT